MNLKMLKAAVTMYAASAECSDQDQVTQAMEAFTELSFAEQTMDLTGCASYDVYPVPWLYMDDLINHFYYDDIGRLCRRYFDNTSDAPQCRRNTPIIATITKKAIDIINEDNKLSTEPGVVPQFIYRDAIRFVIDLWLDNEADAVNNPDGTFNPNNA